MEQVELAESEVQLYLPTTRETKISLSAHDINKNLEINLQRAVEKKFGNKFFSFGHIRPGTIKILNRSIGNKINTSDFTGKMNFNIIFQCEVFLPQIGMEIDARVKSINKIGILAKSDSNRLTVLLSKPHQTNLELFTEVMVESRIRAKILDFKINGQDETIVVVGDLVRILQGVYQNYQLPRIDGTRIELVGEIVPTNDIRNLYIDYSDFMESLNSKSLMDPYAMIHPDNYSRSDWNKIRQKKVWQGFKDYWHTVRSMVEEYELVYPSGGYNGGNAVATLPFQCQPISRSFFKLWELLHRYKEIFNRLNHESDLTILNLGECPGGFIQACAHYRMRTHSKSNDTYFCYSLDHDSDQNVDQDPAATPTEEESVNKSGKGKLKFKKGTATKPEPKKNINLSWECPTSKGQIKRLGNKLNLLYGDHTNPEDIKRMIKDLNGAKADLITADGAYTHDKVYNYEEIVNYKIFFGEIAAAILNQKLGGTFIIKIFDILTNVTRQMLLLLNHYWSEIFITKPDFSRPASSEKYVICLGFKGVETSNQSYESLQATIYTLMKVWNEKIDNTNNRTDIYFPNNEVFILSLLNYQIGDDEEFSRKLQEISRDHVMKQSGHIIDGIHLIHTKSIFDQKTVRQLKEYQLKQAINWCQRYGLDHTDKIELTTEEFVDTQIINTRNAETYTINEDLNKEETFLYLRDEYQNVSMDYFRERTYAFNGLLSGIFSDYINGELYQFTTSRLDPATQVLNKKTNLKWNNRQYAIYEILSDHLKTINPNFKAFVNLDDSIDAIAVTTLQKYFLTHSGSTSKLDWVGNVALSNGQNLSNVFKEQIDRWLMSESNVSGSVTDNNTLNIIRNKFKDPKSKVDLYLSNFYVPLEESDYGKTNILNQERYYCRDYIGQFISGLMSLNDGGTLIMRQWTFFEPITISLITLMATKLFKEVTISKPLVSSMDGMDNYLIAKGFKLNEADKSDKLDKIIDDLMEYISNLQGSRDEIMQQNELPPLPTSVMTMFTEKEYKETQERLVYTAYRMYVLNQYPRLQINLDIFHNKKYKLNSSQMSAIKHLLEGKQEITNKDESSITRDDADEIKKIQNRMEEIYQETTNNIQKDFSYILQETSKNWLDNYKL
jgi:23S rRNA U2552 (ribose-2'-O)-methylase RlmE/FtsJ